MQIKELEAELNKSEQERIIEDLEKRLNVASDQVDGLQSQVESLGKDLADSQDQGKKETWIIWYIIEMVDGYSLRHYNKR